MFRAVGKYGWAIALWALTWTGIPAMGATYYVDPTAPSVGDGTLERPFQGWYGVPIKGGNTYLQRRGTVFEGTLGVFVYGTSGRKIRLGAYGEGPPPVIDGEILLQTTGHIIIEDFEIRNGVASGVQVLSGCHHVELRRLTVYHCAGGISIGEDAGGNNLIEDCTVFENDSSGIAIMGGATGPGSESIIRNCTVYRNGLHGVQIKGNYYIVEGCEIHNNGLSGIPGTSAVHIYSPSAAEPFGDNNIVRNNRVSNQNDLDGFDGNGIQADHYSDGNEIYGNEVFHNDGGGIFIHDSANCVVRNNVMYANARDRAHTRPEPAEMNITSRGVDVDRAENNTVLDNIIVATNPEAVVIYVDDEASHKPQAFGGNALYHESGGMLWRVSEARGSDMALWNQFAEGHGDDFVLNHSMFTPPAPPPAYMLDTTFVVHSPVFTTLNPDAPNILLGGPEPDTFVGGPFDDTLVGNGGDDNLAGGAGHDWLVGGIGNDILMGEDGYDFLTGGDGDDLIYGGPGNDEVSAGGGHDVAYGGEGDDNLILGPGDDQGYGEEGDDLLTGGPGNDLLKGGPGNDLSFGEAGDDVLDESDDVDGNNSLFGGPGDDILIGGGGDDRLIGGPGIDRLDGGGGQDWLDDRDDDLPSYQYGGEGNDFLFGGNAADELDGGPGDDVINAGGGDDMVYGGEGNDVLEGGPGFDTLDAGPGNDVINETADTESENVYIGGPGDDVIATGAKGGHVSGGPGGDIVSGGPGPDVIDERDDPSGQNLLDGGDGPDVIFGGGGADQINGGGGDDELDGGPGDDTIEGGPGNDMIIGGEGLDLIEGGPGDDVIDERSDSGAANLLFGQAGNDTIYGGQGSEQIHGDEGEDWIEGGPGDDAIFGGADADTLIGGAGNDFISGGGGDDIIDSGEGNDIVSGGFGNDTIWAGDGDDALDGGMGDDDLDGGAGSDVLVGGPGNDRMRGGDGPDFFTFESGSGVDVVIDFGPEDTVVVEQGLNSTKIDAVADLLARMMDSPEGVMLDLGAGNTVLLEGVAVADINAEDNLIVRARGAEPVVRVLSVPPTIAAISDFRLALPISIDDATGISSFSFDVQFDSNIILEYVDCVKGPLLETWTELTVVADGNTLHVESSGANPLTGSGVLMELGLQVKAEPQRQIGAVTFLSAEANNTAVPIAYQNGLMIVVDKLFVDVNGDQVLDATDIQLVVNAILGLEIPEGVNPDVNRDLRHDAVDLQLVLNAVNSVAGEASE